MNYPKPVSLELENKIRNELASGERILWLEQPIPRFLTAVSISTFLFGIPWTAFTIFWMFAAAGFRKPELSRGIFNLFPLFGLPFFLVGIGMLTSPLWSYRKALKTVYAITDRRAFVLISGRTTTIRSYLPERLQDIHRIEKRDGTGDVIFGPASEGNHQAHACGFLNIRNPKAAEQTLRNLVKPKSDEYRI